jgi:hypothetical protein
MDYLFATVGQGLSDNVQISIISAVSGIAIAYIVNVAAKKVQENKAQKQPKDRMEQMFDGYERLIKQMSEEDERKARVIRDQQIEINQMKQKLTSMEDNLQHAQDELIDSHQSKVKLTRELEKMRHEYKAVKETK